MIRGHTTFLMILVLLTEIAIGCYPSLPSWMTERLIPRRFGRDSVFELLCVALVVLIAYVEKIWIYIPNGSASADDLAEND